jgi:hypothetical protein
MPSAIVSMRNPQRLRDQPPAARTSFDCGIVARRFQTVIVKPVETSVCIRWRSRIVPVISGAPEERHPDDDDVPMMLSMISMISIDVAVVRSVASMHALRVRNRRMRPVKILCIDGRRSAEKQHRRSRGSYEHNLLHMQAFIGWLILSIEPGRPYHDVTGILPSHLANSGAAPLFHRQTGGLLQVVLTGARASSHE